MAAVIAHLSRAVGRWCSTCWKNAATPPARRCTPTPTSRLRLRTRRFRYPALRFGDQIAARLIGAPGRTDAGLLIWLGLTSAAPPDTYSIGLHVTDATGTLVAQDDTGLPADANSCLLFDLPIRSLPPGDYQVEAIVYDWRTGERLPGVGFDGETTDSPALMQFSLP
ncbi:MAG: hypothetical protein LC121_00835 [Anaerolineae bacterium]|nr:hypothetical protein [Anaerolineae bacterium]